MDFCGLLQASIYFFYRPHSILYQSLWPLLFFHEANSKGSGKLLVSQEVVYAENKWKENWNGLQTEEIYS
jgi:hypothetical protein